MFLQINKKKYSKRVGWFLITSKLQTKGYYFIRTKEAVSRKWSCS